VASRAPFSRDLPNSISNFRELPSTGTNVPKNSILDEVVTVRVKSDPRTLATRRLVSVPRYATKKIVIRIRVIAKSVGSKVPVFTTIGTLLSGLKLITGYFQKELKVRER
jgi:hypothetical protein